MKRTKSIHYFIGLGQGLAIGTSLSLFLVTGNTFAGVVSIVSFFSIILNVYDYDNDTKK